MKCAIMQPTYFPWLGYFELIDSCDTFIFLDTVQIVKNTSKTWDCRNRIKTSNGELFLSYPIKRNPSPEINCFNNTFIDNTQNWRIKHLRSIEMNYKRAPFYSEVFEFIQHLLVNDFDMVADLNINIIKSISEKIGLKANFINASNLLNITGTKDDRLVNICKLLGADSYISPKGSAEYIENEKTGGAFTSANIKLSYQNYLPVDYPQLSTPFISHLSIIDLLFNVGFNSALMVINKGRQTPLDSITVKK